MIALLMRVTRYYEERLTAQWKKSFFYMLAVSLRQSFVTNRLVTILRWWMAGLFCTYLYFNIIVRLLISIFSRKAWFTSRLRCCFSCSQFPNFVISVQVWWRWDGKTVRGITKPHAANCGRASSCLVFIEIGLSLLNIKTRYSLANLYHTGS